MAAHEITRRPSSCAILAASPSPRFRQPGRPSQDLQGVSLSGCHLVASLCPTAARGGWTGIHTPCRGVISASATPVFRRSALRYAICIGSGPSQCQDEREGDTKTTRRTRALSVDESARFIGRRARLNVPAAHDLIPIGHTTACDLPKGRAIRRAGPLGATYLAMRGGRYAPHRNGCNHNTTTDRLIRGGGGPRPSLGGPKSQIFLCPCPVRATALDS
ncbi:hypothetical protein F4861DRAFT_459079 [Xylaria intraflava]|nr:hypothetical protein F4861DRAFT_459079 [Xylaria intraflava]